MFSPKGFWLTYHYPSRPVLAVSQCSAEPADLLLPVYPEEHLISTRELSPYPIDLHPPPNTRPFLRVWYPHLPPMLPGMPISALLGSSNVL